MTLRAVDPFAGDKGFVNLSTGALAGRLEQYRQLRDHPLTAPALMGYARQTVREIRAELQRRTDGLVAA